LDADLNWSTEDTNPLVKHLMMWRHKVFAHRDVKKTLAGNLAEQYPVTYDDVAALLERGFEIMNRYYGVFFSTYFSREVHSLGDYEKLLRTLQDRVELWEAKFEAERQRAMRESQE
jgi:hypothetical protein